MRSRRRSRLILSQFVAAASAIFLLVTAAVAGLYLKAIRAVEEEARERNGRLLERTRDLVDAHLGQVDRMLTRIERSPAVSAFLTMTPFEPGSPSLVAVVDASAELREYRLRNDFVRAVFLYAKRSGILLSSEHIYLNPPAEYAYCVGYGDLDWEGFKGRFLDAPSRMAFAPAAPMVLDGGRVSAVLCANTVPPDSGLYGRGALVAAIDAARLAELLGRPASDDGDGGAAFVADAAGRLLCSAGSPSAAAAAFALGPAPREGRGSVRRETADYVVFEAFSESFGLRYASVVPRTAYRRKIDAVQRTAVFLSLAFALVGAAVSYLLAVRGARPLLDIARLLRDSYGERLGESSGGEAGGGPDGDGPGGAAVPAAGERVDLVDSIQADLSRLLKSNAELEAASERRAPVLRHLTLLGILEGTAFDGDSLALMLRDARLPLRPDGWHRAGVATFSDIRSPINAEKARDLEMKRVILGGALERRLGAGAYACELEPNRLALVFLDEADGARRARIAAFHAELADEYGLSVRLALGPAVRGLASVPSSFRAASRVLDWNASPGGPPHALLEATDHPDIPRDHPYPLDLEARVAAAAKAGNTAALDSILSALRAKLADDPAGLRQASDGLSQTLRRLLADVAAEGAVAPDLPEDGAGRFLVLAEALRSLSDARAQALDGSDAELKDKLAAYLANRYDDPCLNLYMAAKAFDRKESFLYYFFKDAFGRTFASYLEELRMARAAEILSGTDASVDETARLCGYSSAHSFRRAFKRRHGVAPADYRNVDRPT